MASLAQLIARVRFFIDEPTAANFTDADITYAINVAQQDVAKEIVHEYEDYFEKVADLNPTGGGTIIGTELYTLPADFLKFKRIERTDTGEILRAIDLNEKMSNPTTSSILALPLGAQPAAYYVTGNSVGFTPTPLQVIPIRMYYVYRLPDLDSSNIGTSDISAIPAEHHDALAVRAAIDMFIKDESDTKALETRFTYLMDELRRTLRQRQVQDPKHVRRSSYGGLIV